MNSLIVLFASLFSIFVTTPFAVVLSMTYHSLLPFAAYIGLWILIAIVADEEKTRREKLRWGVK